MEWYASDARAAPHHGPGWTISPRTVVCLVAGIEWARWILLRREQALAVAGRDREHAPNRDGIAGESLQGLRYPAGDRAGNPPRPSMRYATGGTLLAVR